MGLFDKIRSKDALAVPKTKPKLEKAKSEQKTNSVENPEPTISFNKKYKENNVESSLLNIIDKYSIKIDGVEFNIVIGKKDGVIHYEIPEIAKINNTLSNISEEHISKMKSDISESGFQKIGEVQGYVSSYSERNGLNLKNNDIQNLAKYFYLIIGKLGFLEIPLHDDRLEEIMINGLNIPSFVFHRKHQMCKTNIVFNNEEELSRIIENIAMLAGRAINSRTPMLDAFLPDGSRVNATTQDVTLRGYTLTIRKFSSDPLTIIDLIKFGTFNPELAAFLWQAVEGYFGAKPANTLIVGGTGSGKTTTLNVVSMFSMYTDRIITIEDTPELQIPHEHVIKMITRLPRPGVPEYEITMNDLIKNALRMRPDRLFVGEVRGAEAQSLLIAMNTGHDGALVDDEPIYLSNGHIINIGEFVDKFFEEYNSTKIKENNGFEWIDISNEGIFIKSFNKSTLKIEDKLISKVWRKKYSGKMIKIKTKRGNEITLTHDHPIYILNNKIFEINAEMVNINDYIALPKEYNGGLDNEYENEYEIENKYKNLPVINNRENPDMMLLINSDIYWDKVICVEEIEYEGYIYDLTVEDNHTYVAGKYGGFIVSNCSGTLHANSADEAIIRLINPPMNVPKVMISSLDFIINQQRIKRNRRTIRRILGIIEIGGSGEDISKTNLFKYDGASDSIRKEGICMWEEQVCEIAGITRDELIEDRINRMEVIKYAVKNNIRDIKRVGELIKKYQENPENILRTIL